MNDPHPDQQCVWQTEQDRIRATLQLDIPALAQVLADDYFYINSRGGLITKAEFLAALQAGVVKYKSQDLAEVLIRVYGDVAILTGRLHETGTSQDQAFDEQFRITRVYVRNASQSWRSVAYHSSHLSESAE